MSNNGPRSRDDAGPRELGAPTKIDVFPVGAFPAGAHVDVEASDGREQVHPGEEAGARHGEDTADLVVLGLVELPLLDSGNRDPETSDAETDLQQALRHVP